LVAQNTQLNAGPRRTGGFPFAETHDSASGTPILDHVATSNQKDIPTSQQSPITSEAPTTPTRPARNSSTPTSRSASFSIPDDKAGTGRPRRILSPGGTPAADDGGMGEEVEEEDEVQDPDFKKKRAGHYGGEAEAMKLAQVSESLVSASGLGSKRPTPNHRL